MKFNVKDFNALTKKFQDAETKLINSHGKKSLSELDDLRKDEFRFLKLILAEVAKIPARDDNYKPHFDIMLGAILVIQRDIELNRAYGQKLGFLHDLLKDIIDTNMSIKVTVPGPTPPAAKAVAGTKAIAKANAGAPAVKAVVKLPEPTLVLRGPSTNQISTAHLALCSFLNMIYADNNPRSGLKEAHPLSDIPLPTLKRFVDLSHTLADESHKKKTYELGGAENTAIGLILTTDIKPLTLATDAKPATYTWDVLLKAYDDLMLEELGDKRKAKVELLDKPRADQLLFLKAVVDNLRDDRFVNALKDKNAEKTAILAGCMLFVRELISTEKGYVHFDQKIELPLVHAGLSKILNIKALTHEDARVLMTSAYNFVTHMCIDRTTMPGQEMIRGKNPFVSPDSGKPVVNKPDRVNMVGFNDVTGKTAFNLVGVTNFMQQFIQFCRKATLAQNVKSYKQALGQPEARSTLSTILTIGGLFGKSKKPVGADTAAAPVPAASADDDIAEAIPDVDGAAASATATATPAPKPATTAAAKPTTGTATAGKPGTTAAAKSGTAAAAKSGTAAVVKLSDNKAAFKPVKPISGASAAPTSGITVTDAEDFDNDLSYRAATPSK